MFIIHRTFETIKNHAKVVLRLMAVTCNNVGDKPQLLLLSRHSPVTTQNIYIYIYIYLALNKLMNFNFRQTF